MKHKYTAYFDDSSLLGRKIIGEVEEKRGAERQNFIRELAHIGYVAKLAGFGEFNGHLVTDSGERIVNNFTHRSSVPGHSEPKVQKTELDKIVQKTNTPALDVKSDETASDQSISKPARKTLKSKLSKL